uniref:Uncharacterized protein n=1 Tax=Oncorhynchus tshawytscha TaxID=74940 RepID=A0A8C8ETP5_ONCTS
MDIGSVNDLPYDDFVNVFGTVLEKSQIIPAAVWSRALYDHPTVARGATPGTGAIDEVKKICHVRLPVLLVPVIPNKLWPCLRTPKLECIVGQLQWWKRYPIVMLE